LTSKSGRSGRSGARSRSGRSGKSGKSGYTEEDFDEMQIEEIDVLIEKAQRDVEILLDQKRKYLSNKMWTKKTK